MQQLPLYQMSEPLQHATFLVDEFPQAAQMEIPTAEAFGHFGHYGHSEFSDVHGAPLSVLPRGKRGMDIDPFEGENPHGQEKQYMTPAQAQHAVEEDRQKYYE